MPNLMVYLLRLLRWVNWSVLPAQIYDSNAVILAILAQTLAFHRSPESIYHPWSQHGMPTTKYATVLLVPELLWRSARITDEGRLYDEPLYLIWNQCKPSSLNDARGYLIEQRELYKWFGVLYPPNIIRFQLWDSFLDPCTGFSHSLTGSAVCGYKNITFLGSWTSYHRTYHQYDVTIIARSSDRPPDTSVKTMDMLWSSK